MAKFLTLNTHSWLEANSLKKLFDLAENIYIENYDVICLQEINQDIRGLAANDVEGYEKLPSSPNYTVIIMLFNWSITSEAKEDIIIGLGLITILDMISTMKAL